MPVSDILGIGGRTAVVSGSSRGVGRAVALALAGAGVNVAVNYLANSRAAEEVAAIARSLGARAITVRADVTRDDEARGLVKGAEEGLGPVDILVNCAHGRIARTYLEESGWDEHMGHLEGILKGALNLTRAAIGPMRERGWGRVVSVGNNMVMQPVRGYSAYSSAMAALMGFTRNLAAEAGPWGITANLVSAGFVSTPNAPHTTEKVRRAIADSTPLGRLAEPEDVAGAVLFFCSELGRFVTGANLSVDGGKVMG